MQEPRYGVRDLEVAIDALRLEKRDRIFVVKASQAYVDPSMNARALSSYGRLDVVARAAIAALMTRAGVRRDTVFYAVLEGRSPSLVIELDGGSLEAEFLSEAEFGEIARRASLGDLSSGVALYEASFEGLASLLIEVLGREHVYYLHEMGTDVSKIKLDRGAAFLLGDHLGVDARTERWLRSQGVVWVSLGSTPYFTEHCITFVHAVLDGLVQLQAFST